MKLDHFSAVFSIIFLTVIYLIAWRENCAGNLEREKRIMEAGMDRAVDTAAGQLAAYCDGMLHIDCEQVLDSFLSTLYAGFGVLEHASLRKQILDRIAFFIIVSEKEIYIWMPEKQGCIVQEPPEKQKDRGNGQDGKQGTPDESQGGDNGDRAQSWGSWDRILFPVGAAMEERSKILEQILNTAAGQYQAGNAGAEFIFRLPYQDACLWLRGVDEPCVLALWYGKPYRLGGKDYWRYFFSGAVVHKK